MSSELASIKAIPSTTSLTREKAPRKFWGWKSQSRRGLPLPKPPERPQARELPHHKARRKRHLMANALTQKEREKTALLLLAEFLFDEQNCPFGGERPGSCSGRTQTRHGERCRGDGEMSVHPLQSAAPELPLARPLPSLRRPTALLRGRSLIKAKARWAGDSAGPGWGGTVTLCLLPLLLP